MAETTTDKASPSATPASSPTQGEAARAATESTAAEALAPQRLGALERPNIPPAEPRRDIPDALTNLHSGSRTDPVTARQEAVNPQAVAADSLRPGGAGTTAAQPVSAGTGPGSARPWTAAGGGAQAAPAAETRQVADGPSAIAPEFGAPSADGIAASLSAIPIAVPVAAMTEFGGVREEAVSRAGTAGEAAASIPVGTGTAGNEVASASASALTAAMQSMTNPAVTNAAVANAVVANQDQMTAPVTATPNQGGGDTTGTIITGTGTAGTGTGTDSGTGTTGGTVTPTVDSPAGPGPTPATTTPTTTATTAPSSPSTTEGPITDASPSTGTGGGTGGGTTDGPATTPTGTTPTGGGSGGDSSTGTGPSGGGSSGADPAPVAPTLEITAGSGAEDSSLALTIGLSAGTAGSTTAVTVAGLPPGASLSAGVDLGNGTWSLSPADLPGLMLLPPPDYAGTIGLTVTAVSTDGSGRQATSSGVLSVTVSPQADAPTLTLTDATGGEGQPISLGIAAAMVTPAAGEVLSVVIGGVPAGATLSAGTANGDGTWTLSAAQLAGLTLTPPADFSGTLALTVTATSSVNGTQASRTGTLTIAVAPEADAPSLSVTAATGAEDQPVTLTLSAGLTNPAAGEVLAIVIGGVPAGAVLSAGTDNGNGTWTLSPSQLAGLTLIPPANFAGTLNLTVTATSTVNGTQASRTEALAVTVTAVADAPDLSVADAAGTGGQPIALPLSSSLVSPAAGETLGVVIGGVPAGATLSAGTDNGDGTWTLSAGQLTGLTLTPPAGFSGTLALTVTATSSLNGTEVSRSGTLTVSVAPSAAADEPALAVSNAAGTEDHAVALTIATSLATPVAGEVLTIVIGGVPAGAALSAGTQNADGSWTLTPAQLAGLTLTPPVDFSGTIALTVTATSAVNGTQASRTEALTVTIAPEADAPSLSVADATGVEDHAIALTIAGSLTHPAAGEVLNVVIAGMPAGTLLSAGIDNGDGTWTLSAAQLAGLTLTPPADFSGTLNLTVTATASVNGTQASQTKTLTVTVDPEADAPNLSVTGATGTEDQPITLTIASSLTNPTAGEVLSVVIAGVPPGAMLSAGTDNGDGTWTLSTTQLTGLTLTPPADFSGTLNLTVTATASVNGTQASRTEALTVTVTPEADAPSLTVADAVGTEDQPIALTIAGSLTHPAAGEVLSIVVASVPAGAMLSAGIDNGDGTWTLTPAQLSGLTLTPPADFSGTIALTVTATSTVNGTQASRTEALTVTIAPEADAPSLSVAIATGAEDHAIALTVSSSLSNPAAGEGLSIVVSGIPNGAMLSAGTDNGDGTWTLTPAQLTGLTLTPPANFSGSLALTFTATASVNETQASQTQTLTVTVNPEADIPSLSVVNVTGSEDQPIALTIASSLTTPAAGEVLNVVIAGIPAGATLSAGTDNGDGTWTLSAAQLTGLTLTPPADFFGTLNLTVTATASVNSTQANRTEALTVTVAPEADAPSLSVADATGVEDHAVALTLSSSLISPAAGELLSIVIAGVPAGTMLSAGIDNGDGTWTLSVAQLASLTLTPPADFSGTLNLTVTATSTINGTQASRTETLTVTVDPEADAPSLTVADATGVEDHAIALTLSSSLTSPAAGELLSIVIAGVPAGTMLSAGIDNGDGTWTLSAAQFAGLTLTPPADFSGTLNLTVTATASVNGTQASRTETLTVTVTPEADAPSLTVADAVGTEDQPVALTIAGSLIYPAAGEVLSVVIVGIPAGAALSAGTDNGDGTWTLTSAQLSGLTLTPPADFSGTLALTVTATSSVNGTQASRTEALTVTIAPDADTPSLSVASATGIEDHAVALTVSSSLTNPAAGEVLSVVVTGLPTGATLSAGTDNGDGTWTLSPSQLTGLTLTPPADFSGTLALTVTATSSINGTQASRTETLTVTVTPEADAPSLSISSATGLEDQPIALTIASSLTAPAAGEVLSVVITGLPAGATLSAGIDNGDGTWTLSAAQLTGLTLTPPADFSGTIALTVTATSSVNGTQASRTEALTVTVAPDADAPSLSVADATGIEDHAIALTVSSSLTSPAAGELLSIVIGGIPNGAMLSAGTHNGDGTWTLTPAQLTGLTLTPPADFSGTIALTVTATSFVNGTQASQTETLTVTVTPEADAPTLAVLDTAGLEDQAVALVLSSSLIAPAVGEVLSVVIAGIPTGAALSAGTDNGDGTWTLSSSQLAGLTLTPPTDFSGSLTLSVTATSSVNGTQANRTETLTVTVDPEADAPNLSVASAAGAEDQPITLTIASSLTNPAAGEVLSVVITGVPPGAMLSAGIDNADGTWTLSAAQLAGLTLTPPADFSGTLNLTVTATASVNGTQASRADTLTVTVMAEADAPSLAVADAVGIEDQPVALTIAGSLTSPAVGEVLSVVIAGVPAGATLSAGTDNGDGTWTLSAAQLAGLTLTPPADFSGTLNLTVTATASVNGTQASRTEALTVTVAPEADAPSLSVASATGSEDQPIALTIASSLTNPAAGEMLSVTFAGVPAGATLSAGTDNGDGTWTMSPAQLAGLTLTPPADFSGSLALTVTATSTINGNQASRTETLTVTVTPEADAPSLSVVNATGVEDHTVALTIGAALVSPVMGEALSIVIAGVPAGATLSAGTDNGDGTWTLSAVQLTGLTLTPPADFSGSLALTVTATSSVNGTQASRTETLTVTVTPDADAPSLTVANAAGVEDHAVELTLSSSLTNPAAGEVLSVVIADLPNGATLSTGTDNGDGTWTLTPAQLTGLTLTPPADFSGTLALTVTATASVNGTQASRTETLTVNVTAEADAPSLTVADAVGTEDQPVALTIAGSLIHPAAGEVLDIVIAGVPAGAMLSAGTDNGDGTWTLTSAQLTGLTLTPPADFSGTIALTITATSAVDGTQASRTETLTVSIAPEAAIAETPLLNLADASGSEDHAVALTIAASLATPVPGEMLSIVVGGLPNGATLSAGTDNGDGTWTLTPAQLAGLTLTSPADFSGSLTLTVTATSSVNGTQASQTGTLTVTVAPEADAPSLSVADATGIEDHAVALSLSSSLTNPAASEVLNVVIAGLPNGATLSAGTDNGDGTWTLTPAQLSGLTLTPPADFSGTLALTVTATASVNGTQASRTETLTVTVTAEADAPSLTVADAVGTEDQPIALTIASSLTVPAAGEVLNVVIAGVPAGAALSAGTDNGDGTWTLSPAHLTGLTLTPPADFSSTLALTVTATSTINGTQASRTETLTVTVTPEADAPSLTVADATGVEDHAIALTLSSSLTSPAAGETLSIVVGGVPAGATLSAGTDNGDGTWTLSAAQFAGLTLTPPADFSGTLNLTVTATASVNGTQASRTETLAVTVTAEADAPSLSVADATGSEDQPITLNLSSSLADPAAGEVLSVVVADVPAGAMLSAGIDNGDGTWTLSAAQLAGLTLTPPADFSGTLNLTVTATASVNGTQASRTETLAVTVTAEADAPSLAVADAFGTEDQPVALTIAGSLIHPAAGEVLSVVIAGIPAGATLSAGTDNGDGTWTLTPAQLSGLTLTPPADFSGTLALTVTATSSVNGTQASRTEALTVTIAPDADTPSLSVASATGIEDHAVALTLSSSLTNPAAGEMLSVTFAGVPTGATLSAGTDNGDGTWTLSPSQLTGLTLTPPANFSGTLALTVTATSSVNGTQASRTETLNVTVTPEADAPSLSISSATGLEDQPIALTIASSLTAPAAGEVLSVVIAGVPAGATLSAGIDNGDGTWTLSAAQLTGLTLTPPADFSGMIALTVTATSTVNGTQASRTEALTVTVAPDADTPSLSVADAAGTEDLPVALSLSASLTTPAAGEVLSVVVSGIPNGAMLSAGTDNGDGTWTLSAAQLTGLTLTPPADFSGMIALTVTATSTVNGTQASRTEALTVTVAPDADAPSLSVADATGIEDHAIALTVSSNLTSPAAGELLSIVIGGIPYGAMLSAGTDNGDGTWTLSAAQLSGLTLTPPADFSGSLALTITATASVNGTQASRTETLTVTVNPDADTPSLSVADAAGTEDLPVALSLSASLTTPAAGEVLSVVIGGVPAGATLSAGTANGDGTWTLSAAQLTGLTLTPPADFSGTLNLTVTATVSVNGTQASRTETLAVTVAPAADAPSLSVIDAIGIEDHAVALTLSSTLTTPAAGKVLSIVVAGIPAGATLSAGADNGDGTWTLSAAQLTGLTLTPPADFSGSLALTVTATSSINGTQASRTETLTVTVTPDADAPSLTVADATDVEDHAVALTLSSSLTNPAAGEVLGIVIGGIPNGAVLSAGTDNGDGTWTLSAAQLTGLTLTPPADFFGTLHLTVTATASVNGTQASRTETLTITVTAEADAPSLTVADAFGTEDQPVALTIAGSLIHPAAGEVLDIVIAGVPTGATLSAGTDNDDGTWTLTSAQLSGLTLTPPADFSGMIALTVTATSAIDGTQASRTETLTVSIAPEAAVAETPLLNLADASGSEDHAVALTIAASLATPMPGEMLSIVVSGLPNGATLSAGTDNGDGTWTLSPAQLTGLTLTPPADFFGTLNLTVTASASVNGTQASRMEALTVTVAPQADAPSLSVVNATGIEDHAIALTLSSSLTHPAAGEVLSVMVSGVPTGAMLSAGTDNGDGTWTLTPAQLTGLTLTPPADFSGSLTLTVTATSSVNGTQASRTEALTVTVTPEADAPNLSVTNVAGVEDHVIALTLSGSLIHPAAGEVLGVVISGVPSGAMLSAGTNNGNGTWTLSPAQLTGLTLTPPANVSGTIALTVTATSSVNGIQASRTEALTVTVTPEADAPSLSVANAVGREDHPVALTLSTALTSPAAGEVLNVVIAGVPAGATLSAGTDNGNGTWTLSPSQLTGLTLTPPTDFSGTIALTVTATASVNGTQANSSRLLTVTVTPEADTPSLAVANVAGVEDHAIALTLSSSLTHPAAGEVLSVVIVGIPTGAMLSAGTDNGDGSWTLTPAQLSGLTLTPPANFSGTLNLAVTATASVNGTQASRTEALTVTVAPEADTPSLALLPAYGREDQPISLAIAAHLADIDGSETLGVIVSGVPAGATLSAGTANGNGTWTLTAAQLSGLTLTPPKDFSGSFTLSVTARSTETGAAGASASTSLSLPVTVTGVADTPLLTTSASSGAADTAIPLHLSALSQDIDHSETVSVRISGIPAGARLSHGVLTSSAGGFTVWTVGADQLADLTITPPCHYTGVMDLTVRAVATEADGDSAAGAVVHVPVTVTGSGGGISAGVALNLGVVAGVEDAPVALNLLGGLTALLGSATIDSVIVTGVGNATLSAGVKLADGSYLLTPAQLAGLALIPPHDLSGSYSLSATVNLGGSQLGASVSATLGVQVAGVADAPTLSVSGSAGAYASAIPLTIAGALTDTSGTEHLHYVIGVATGAHLSAGIDNGDGTWTVLPSQLSGLTVTPPYGFSGSLPVTVTAVSQEANGAVASVQKALTVSVAAPTAALLATLASLVAVTGTEDVGINLGATLLSLNLGSIATVAITGIPSGATLTSGGIAVSAGSISASLLSGLTLTMPANYSGDFQLGATVKLVGGLITLNKTLAVHVTPVADLPSLTVGATITGTEDQPVPLGISGSLLDLDGSEALSFTVAGVPAGVRLSAGHVNPVTGNWILTAAELSGLALLPPPDFSGTISLTVGAVASELLGAVGVTVKPVTITIAPVTDTPILALPAAVGAEDSPIALTIGAAAGDIDGSETITGLQISGLPAGATLNHGTALGNGAYALTKADLVGLTMTPPANYAGTLSLTVTATAKDGTAAPASASGSLSVTVKPVADAPLLTVADCNGRQGHDIALGIGAALVDTDGSEVLSVTIAGLPVGASLSAGLNNGDGSWTLTAAQLTGLKLHAAGSVSGDLHLTVTAHALDGGIGPCNQSLAETSAALTVHIQPEIAPPNLSLPDLTVVEHGSALLDLGVGLAGVGLAADVSLTVAGLPVGASLSAGVHNQDGSWTLAAAQLLGLRLTPPADSLDDFTLTVTASATVAGLAAVQASGSLHVTVLPDLGGGLGLGIDAGVAIAPSLSLSVLGTQLVAGATISLDAGFHDGDLLSLGGLRTETDASGHLVIAGTGIQVGGGGYDAAAHTLTLSGTASASVYETVLKAIRLDPSSDCGSRSVTVDLFDGAGHTIDLAHQAITLDVGLDGSVTSKLLSGAAALLDHTLNGLMGDGLGGALGGLGLDADLLAGVSAGDGSATLLDDPLHHNNANNVYV